MTDPAPRLAVILNPAAAGGRARRSWDGLAGALAEAGLDYTLVETDAPGHATELAQSLAASNDIIAAAGGDGTVHEVANGLLRAPEGVRAALAVVPVGTGNDFVKLLTGRDPRDAVAALVAGRFRTVDVGRAVWHGGSEYFVNGMGTGIDVEVVRQMSRARHVRGVAGYLLAVLKALRVFRPISLRLRQGDESWSERRVMIIAVGNGVSQGGGFYLTPGARPDDGRLDLCMVDEIGLARIARALPRLMRGSHTDLPEVTMSTFQQLEVRAEAGRPLFFQVDGELREPAGLDHLRIEVVPQALRVIVGSA